VSVTIFLSRAGFALLQVKMGYPERIFYHGGHGVSRRFGIVEMKIENAKTKRGDALSISANAWNGWTK